MDCASMLRVALVLSSLAAATGAAAQAPPLPTLPPTGGVAPLDQEMQKGLTPAQKDAILQAVKRDNRKVTPPVGASAQAQVGAELPPSIELYMLPDTVLAQIPAAKSYKYTRIEGKVVLVDPTTMRVTDVVALVVTQEEP
jgi:hypothetical protein